MGMNVAIDGPAGAGKSTIAKLAAKELGYLYVDTGAMYRAIALFVLRKGISAEDEKAVALACEEISVEIVYDNKEQQVLLNKENVSKEIRQEAVGNMTSAISVYPAVRKKLLNLQRDLASRADVIMDGRDIATCVLPEAQVKIYLTASVETRAQRRYMELQKKGVDCHLENIKKDIADRDERDMNRKIAPLRQAEDAVFLDSSDMTIEEVVQEVIRLCRRAAEEKGV